jgi:hypothetical protein
VDQLKVPDPLAGSLCRDAEAQEALTKNGPDWEQPTQILPGRLFKFGAQVTF